VVTYIDRVNISVAAKDMMPAFGLTAVQMGTVFSAFVLGYAFFQIPGGWLGDRWGARRVLTAAVLWWSIFTILTAETDRLVVSSLVGGLGALVLVRFLIGSGEAAALPNFNRTVANWLAPSERGLGMGVSIGGIGLGSALTPPLVAWLMIEYGWKTSFYVTGVLGVFVAAAWYGLSRDHPREHPRVHPSELAWITQAPMNESPAPSSRRRFSDLLKDRSVWYLTLSYTMLGYIAYIYLSWFFLYLVNVRHFTVLKGSLLAGAPFIAMAAFCPLGGWLSDRLTQKYGHRKGRSGVGGVGMLLTALLIYAGAMAPDPYVAILLLSLGAGILYATVGAYWASTIDLSHEHSGSLSGLMNMGGNLGGTISPTLTPLIGERWGWPVALTVAAAVAVLGALLWLGVKFEKRG
jgi:MFS transporter, ACS family, glucarate transporter